MTIKEVKDSKKWNQFVKKNKGNFLQSWQWGELKKEYQKVYRLGLFEEGDLRAVAQIFEEYLPLGKYLYIPYGPITSEDKYLDKFIAQIKTFTDKRADFVRVEPINDLSDGKDSFSRFQPDKTLILKLKEEEKLLSGFDKDTRYSVRRAKREGVEVKETTNLDAFYRLLKLAAKRHKFNIYRREYFEKLLQLDLAHLLVAKHKKNTLAAAFTIFFGNTATYLHAGSSRKKREMCASSLLNFEIMNKAFDKGFDKYDFWGIDEEKMTGVTKFKKGFGGEPVEYPKARDIPISRKYFAYKLIHKLKSIYEN
ncbi:MAG: lipid II:glycine glycyltransferase FemX [Patescibacteria group bacterium]